MGLCYHYPWMTCTDTPLKVLLRLWRLCRGGIVLVRHIHICEITGLALHRLRGMATDTTQIIRKKLRVVRYLGWLQIKGPFIDRSVAHRTERENTIEYSPAHIVMMMTMISLISLFHHETKPAWGHPRWRSVEEFVTWRLPCVFEKQNTM